MKQQREWTFLFYADGSNELEAETWKSVQDLMGGSFGRNIYIAVQTSREEQDITALLRPGIGREDTAPPWSGVRRYNCAEGAPPDMTELPNVNMADPKVFCDFLEWGIASFPAKRYMLSITGHIYQFVGMCPDYSGELPLMLGFPELSWSIQQVFTAHQALLEVLILDTCYASTVEILYELGRYEQPAVRYLCTYIGKGPLEGLPYGSVLGILQENAVLPTQALLQALVHTLPLKRSAYGLLALHIHHERLRLLKTLFSGLANTYLICKEAYGFDFSPDRLLSPSTGDYPWVQYLEPIHILLKGLIVTAKAPENDSPPILPIHILHQTIPDTQRKLLYQRLAFSKENLWADMLCGFFPQQQNAVPAVALAPIPMTKNILTAFIYAGNEDLSMEQIHEMIDALILKKGWAL